MSYLGKQNTFVTPLYDFLILCPYNAAWLLPCFVSLSPSPPSHSAFSGKSY